jgi:radical SAM protein with 4Fe4S-binding SPASM domain
MEAVNMEGDYRLESCLWELTLKCTLNCMHCGSVAGKGRARELTLSECSIVAGQIVALGCRELTFIGGEIFLYRGWEEIARFLSDNGLLVNIMSNGFSIGETEINQIKYAKLSNVGISVDGMAKNHNRIRRRADSFDRIARAMDLLNQERIPIAAVTCLLEFNFGDLEDLYAWLVSHNVQLWQIQLVNPMGNMADRRELIIEPEKIPLITDFIREKNKEKLMVIVAADSIGYYDDNETHIRGRRAPVCYWKGCQAGITSLFVDSVGNVKGCGALYAEKFIEGNLRERTLADIWNDKASFSYNRDFDVDILTGQCAGCDVGDECRGGCRASNYFTTNSLYESAYCSRHAMTVGGR